jgi:hypothetical protein
MDILNPAPAENSSALVGGSVLRPPGADRVARSVTVSTLAALWIKAA